MTQPDPVGLAEEANRLVGVAPRRALRVAQDAAHAAWATGDPAAESQALSCVQAWPPCSRGSMSR